MIGARTSDRLWITDFSREVEAKALATLRRNEFGAPSGAKSFGKGNFKALFEAIEREQALRGTL